MSVGHALAAGVTEADAAIRAWIDKDDKEAARRALRAAIACREPRRPFQPHRKDVAWKRERNTIVTPLRRNAALP